MLSKVRTCVLNGIEGVDVEVETDISIGLPNFNIVGLADTSIRESKDRVRAAIKNSGYQFPISRITTNLSPANVRKEGSHLDLPIALGIMKSTGEIRGEISETAFIGELSLDGKLKRIDGALPAVLYLKKSGVRRVVVSEENKREAGVVRGIEVIAPESLRELVEYLNGESDIEPYTCELARPRSLLGLDYSEVKGQLAAKRAIEIAAAGFHNMIMIGPRGSGKTMLAKRIPSIMPEPTFEECLEMTNIYSVSGLLGESCLISERPFRSPHHTVSSAALSGGGINPKPGELSLAHKGVLFLDELPEFKKPSIEVLRQPLEDREINISRVNGKTKYPCDIMLVAAMNPCPCGNYGTTKNCSCSQFQVDRYISRISGPVLDRLDIHVEVGRLEYEELEGEMVSESSDRIKKRVERAREIQKERQGEGVYNSRLSTDQVKRYCALDSESKKIMKEAFKAMGLSARSYDKIIKISRTIADLAEEENIKRDHVLEAVQYRSLERKYWR